MFHRLAILVSHPDGHMYCPRYPRFVPALTRSYRRLSGLSIGSGYCRQFFAQEDSAGRRRMLKFQARVFILSTELTLDKVFGGYL